jgi:hypothetical protein
MIILSRATARAFRALARKCVPSRSRGLAPPVTIRQADGRLTLKADLGEVVLTRNGPAAGDPDTLVIPMALLDAVDGPNDDPVQIEREGTDRVVARWADRGVPRTFPCDLVPVAEDPVLLEVPKNWVVVRHEFLEALHEAGRTAAREPTRYALQRIQVRGKKGQVIGTDGKRAYLRSGFPFPFPDDLLVPAVPVFGARELIPLDDVRVGRTDTRLVVAVGAWSIGLTIDTEGKFPDVAGALPKNLPTVVGVDDRDADALIDALPGLPGQGEDPGAVTLAVGGGAFVRAGTETEAVEVYLSRSTFAGPAGAVPMNRDDVLRMLKLGCRTVRFVHESKPVVGQRDQFLFAAMPLEAGCLVPPTAGATRLETDDSGRVIPRTGPPALAGPGSSPGSADTIPIPPVSERTAMKPTSTLPVPAKPEPNGEAFDPLVEAEGLRNALADVATRAARLVAALRHLKKEKRALSSVWESLKHLNLGA